MNNKCCGRCGETHVGDCSVNQIDSRCVIYNINDKTPSRLLCFLEVQNKTSVHDILEKLDLKLCQLFQLSITDCFRQLIDIGPNDELSITEFLIRLQNYLCTKSDEKVKVSANDPEAGYLFDKITTGECVEKSVRIDPTTNKRSVHISLDFNCIADKIGSLIDIPQCYEIDCLPCSENPDCQPKPITPIITSKIEGTVVKLLCLNFNGTITWYNENDEIVGYGPEIVVETGHKYYAKSSTICGVSPASNIIDVPETHFYTYIKSTYFTKNNCPTNGCGKPCIGSQVLFSKTYTSTISQEHAEQLANQDTQYPIEGQNYANQIGLCECPSCQCVNPTASNTVVQNATCNNGIIQSNGVITATGLSNADKFGISFNSSSYQGPNYSGSYFLGYNVGSIHSTPTSIQITGLDVQTSVIIRVFNKENACFTDLLFSLNPPTCGETGSIEIGPVGISC